MAIQLPPLPNNPVTDTFVWRDWFFKVSQLLVQQAAISWTSIDFSGSNLTSVQTRRHNDLQLIQGGNAGEYYHLDLTQYTKVSTLPVFGTMATQDANNVAITGGTITGISGIGTVTSVTGTAPVSVATGTTTPVISMAAANTSTNGYLTSTDWNTFNNKLSAQVYPGAGIANSTGTAWGTSYGVTGTGNVVLSASPTLTGTLNAATITASANSTFNGVAVGKGAANISTNLAVGQSALTNASTTGVGNVGVSYIGTMNSLTSGTYNMALGGNALSNLTTGTENVAMGVSAVENITTGSFNTGVGAQALRSPYAGSNNVGIGKNAGSARTGPVTMFTPSNGVYIGAFCLGVADNETNSIVIGQGAQGLGSNTTVIGNSSTTKTKLFGTLETTGDATVNGLRVGKSIGSGNAQNTAVGLEALNSNTTGDSNVAIGWRCLKANTTGKWNVALGAGALQNTTSGLGNFGLGLSTLVTNTTGSGNVGIGAFALTNSNGSNNLGIGYGTLENNTSGSGIIAIGFNCARKHADGTTNLTTASASIYIGSEVRGFNNSDSNSIVIGYQAIGTGANTTVIGTSSTTQAKIFGQVSVGGNTPASATATGVAGTITWDANYIYVCTATNTWKRTAIATW